MLKSTDIHEQPLDVTPDLVVWLAALLAAGAFFCLVVAGAVLLSRLRDKISGNITPRRTSPFTWIALVVIVAFVVGDALAVLIPAIQAAREQSGTKNDVLLEGPSEDSARAHSGDSHPKIQQ